MAVFCDHFADAARHPLHVARREALIERRLMARSTASPDHNDCHARCRTKVPRRFRTCESCTIAVTAFAARLARNAAAASAAIAAARRAAVHQSVARFNRATATRGDDLPFVDVGATPASAPPRRQRFGLMVVALPSARTHNRFPPASMRARVGRSIMRIWLTIAEASRYSGASKEGVGTPHDGGSTTQRSAGPQAASLRGYGRGC